MKALTKPLKWHGGKAYLASKIIALMPPRCKNPNAPEADDPGWLHYVEPYAGGLAVLLANDPEGISEVVNDLNGALTNFWTILASDYFDQFRERVEGTPFSEEFWEGASIRCQLEARLSSMDRVGHALNFFVWCRQSLAGRMKGFAPLTRNRTRRGMNEQASAWLNAVEGLPAVHDRLKRVVILNGDAMAVIKQQDGPRTLFYLDPPYLHETRTTTGEYEHEMTVQEHADLLVLLETIHGRFLLSGYRSDVYDEHARQFGWNRHDYAIDNKAAGGKTKRKMVECVWCNF